MEEIAAVPVHVLREPGAALARSNLSREGYMRAVERIRRLIKAGETYQTNLTQRITVQLLSPQDAADVYGRLRRDNPAPFSALLRRASSDVVSASPELFFTAEANGKIRVSPIKGTRPRGETPAEDDALEAELASSEKDRSENIMIVDLLRNDLGRICEFGSINVDSLCRVERHPTVLQMVSDVSGTLRPSETPSSIVRALFPCGSITGAPKRRTMEIISRIEPHRRGISMGAMGISIPPGYGIETRLECSVAIRTMAIAGSTAVFNAGGGIVYDSEPEAEYDESLLKAAALLRSLGAELA
jgi:para-aminobenzoate synthetase component I